MENCLPQGYVLAFENANVLFVFSFLIWLSIFTYCMKVGIRSYVDVDTIMWMVSRMGYHDVDGTQGSLQLGLPPFLLLCLYFVPTADLVDCKGGI